MEVKMAYQLPSEVVTENSGVGLLQYIASQDGRIIPTILFFVFLTISISGFLTQRLRGGANIWLWMSIGGLITSTSSILLFLAEGVVNLYTVIISISMTGAFVLAFIFTSNQD
jgi:hypothetical protein